MNLSFNIKEAVVRKIKSLPRETSVKWGFTPNTKALVWGFTLVELLVVLVIIGILATAITFSVKQSKGKSNYTEIVSDMRSIANAVEQYKQKNGVYPDPTPTDPSGGLVGSYLTSWPTPPCSGYIYGIYGYYFSVETGLGFARISLMDNDNVEGLPDNDYISTTPGRDTILYPGACDLVTLPLDCSVSTCPDGSCSHCCNESLNKSIYHICLQYNEVPDPFNHPGTAIPGNCSCNGNDYAWWCYDHSQPIEELPSKSIDCKDLP